MPPWSLFGTTFNNLVMPNLKRKRKSARGETHDQPIVSLSKLLEDLHTGDARYNFQEECPLFKIPAEIRNTIFSYVVQEQDGQTAIATTDYWYRPDFTHYRYIETTLLRTCRLIWLETHVLPRQQITRRYWAGGSDRRPDRLEYFAREAAQAQLKQQTAKSKAILPCETAQVFIQMFALERLYDLDSIVRRAQQKIALRHLIITIRYTDWWFWESDTPLRIESNWTGRIRLPESLEKLTMELETRQGKKSELDAIVQRQISKWTFSAGDKELSLSSALPESRSYIGTSRPGKTSYSHHDPLLNTPPNAQRQPLPEEMYYHAILLGFVPKI